VNGHICSEVSKDECKERTKQAPEKDGQGQQDLYPLWHPSGNNPLIRTEYVPSLF
jgi:hypothetical protein